MRRVTLITSILILFFAAMVWAASILAPIAITLNASTYTELVNTGGTCATYVVWVDDCTGWTYAMDSSGTNATVVSPDVACAMSFDEKVSAGDTVFWVKATSGTPEFYFQPGK